MSDNNHYQPENKPGVKSEFLNDLCAMYNKTSMSDKEMECYKWVLNKIDFADLEKVKEIVLNRGSKYMPKAIELVNINLELQKERKNSNFTENSASNNKICPICNDFGLIPTIGHYMNNPRSQFQAKYWHACKCSLGSFYLSKHPYYFEKYPNFEIEWDQEKYPKYTDAFNAHLWDLQQQWKAENLNNPTTDLANAPGRNWISKITPKAVDNYAVEEPAGF